MTETHKHSVKRMSNSRLLLIIPPFVMPFNQVIEQELSVSEKTKKTSR